MVDIKENGPEPAVFPERKETAYDRLKQLYLTDEIDPFINPLKIPDEESSIPPVAKLLYRETVFPDNKIHICQSHVLGRIIRKTAMH